MLRVAQVPVLRVAQVPRLGEQAEEVAAAAPKVAAAPTVEANQDIQSVVPS